MPADPRFTSEALFSFAGAVMQAAGCTAATAEEIAAHLLEAERRGIASHGILRLSQYVEHVAEGRVNPAGEARLGTAEGGAAMVDGGNGFGIGPLRLATDTAAKMASETGMGCVGTANVGHTGSIGLIAERGAQAGCLTLILGGGSRVEWRQVAPYGGARAMLPTNPYAIAVPGGARGPVVLDFATSAGAGGKVMAARAAGKPLPEGMIVDRRGRASTDPEDYFNGGALLPMAGPKGYGLALVAELVGAAVSRDAKSGMNWLSVCIDLTRFRAAEDLVAGAEACLAELRDCPPAAGFDRVEVPGERERDRAASATRDGIALPGKVVAALNRTAGDLGIPARLG